MLRASWVGPFADADFLYCLYSRCVSELGSRSDSETTCVLAHCSVTEHMLGQDREICRQSPLPESGRGVEYRSQGLIHTKHTCSVLCHLKAHKLARDSLIVKCALLPDLVVYAFNPSSQRQEDLSEF